MQNWVLSKYAKRKTKIFNMFNKVFSTEVLRDGKFSNIALTILKCSNVHVSRSTRVTPCCVDIAADSIICIDLQTCEDLG